MKQGRRSKNRWIYRAVSALSLLPEPSDGAPNCHSTGSTAKLSTIIKTSNTWRSTRTQPSEGEKNKNKIKNYLLESISAASFNFATVFATPNSNSLPLHCKLQACDFHYIDCYHLIYCQLPSSNLSFTNPTEIRR